MADYERPAGAYTGTIATQNQTKYQDDSAAKVAISSVKIDGDLNRAYQGLNELSAKTVPPMTGNAGKWLTTNGVDRFWQALGALATKATVGTADIDADSISAAKLQTNSVTEDKILAGAVGYTKLKTADIAVAADYTNATAGKISDAAGTSQAINAVANAPGRVVQSVLIPMATVFSTTSTTFVDIGFTANFTPLKATNKLRVRANFYMSNAVNGNASIAQVMVNGTATAIAGIFQTTQNGWIGVGAGAAELTAGAITALPIRVQLKAQNGTARMNIDTANATSYGLAAGSYILIEEIGA